MKPFQSVRAASATIEGPASEPMIHGGAVDEARRRFPGAPEPWIDLSTGINPVAYPLPDIAPEMWSRLPLQSDLAALCEAAAARYGAPDASMIVAASGTQPLIKLLARMRPRSHVFIAGPTYAEHHAAWQREGHDVAEHGDLQAMTAADVGIVVNPDNPTGRVVPAAQLRVWADALAARNGLLIVDEAFMDVMADGPGLAADLPPSTVVLRSFGKAYGLGGLRLGFAIADRATAGMMTEALGHWAVSGPALAVGGAALANDDWIGAARTRLERDAARLDAVLSSGGLTPVGGTPLFRLTAHAEAERIARTFGEAGILLRRFPAAPHWLRFGIPQGEPAWARLSEVVRRLER